MQVYLDNAATTQLDPEVTLAITEFMAHYYGNPSSTHAIGRAAKVVLEKARKKVAAIIGCQDKELLFTSGGTEANNAILKSLALEGKVERIISSPIEHPSILATLAWIEKHSQVEVIFLKVNTLGDIDLTQLENLLKDEKSTLVSLMHANNEIGNLLPIEKVGLLCRKNNALFHSDMVQSFGHLPLNLSELPLDFATGSGHKIYGPKGIGFIYTNAKHAKLTTYMHGGAQERGLRGGTENIIGIIGLAKALELAQDNLADYTAHFIKLKKKFISEIAEIIPSATFNGRSNHLKKSLPTIINICLAGQKNETLLFNLDMQGLYVSEGSACSSGSHEGSHVLECLSKEKSDCNNLRISFSKFTTFEEIEFAIKQISYAI